MKKEKKNPHSCFEKLSLLALKQNRFITQGGLISCRVLLNVLTLKIHTELETMRSEQGVMVRRGAGGGGEATNAGNANFQRGAC